MLPALPDIHIVSKLLSVHLQLVVMVGLTRDGGSSWLSSLCRTRLSQFLGSHSMALYMLHDPLIKVMIFRFDLLQDVALEQMFCVVLTLIISVIATRLVERPFYNYCNSKIKPTKPLLLL